jgi:3',5'-cyclic AMP phosphodiesterase CpdA
LCRGGSGAERRIVIAQFLNREVVLSELQEVREDLQHDLRVIARQGGTPNPDDERLLTELEAAGLREAVEFSGQREFEAPVTDRRRRESPSLADYSFFSRNVVISLLQSALDEYCTIERPDDVELAPPRDDVRGADQEILISDLSLRNAPPPRRTEDGRRIFDKFSITDVRWVRSSLAMGVRKFTHRRPFPGKPARPYELPEQARLVLVGDWGTGLPRARKVADQMRQILEQGQAAGLAQHVVHLGDVYYSGWDHEYRRRFLRYWPVRPDEAARIGSWALNGNHDMYSGGHGYFDTLLADDRFANQQQSSFFSLVNGHWKILGLDTAWDDAALRDPQPSWIDDELSSTSHKVLLLSHHQPFSVYEPSSTALLEKMEPLLAKHSVTGWFWGHEHRCMLYASHMNVDFGRCIGHGGVPVYMWHRETDGYRKPGLYEYRKFIQRGAERWALFGFALLDFDGPVLKVTYIDEDGERHKQETIA